MPQSLDAWASLQASRRPECVALLLNDERLTYGELETLSNQLARCLREAGCLRGDRICLLMPKSPMAIVCMLGIYKAGGIYVPLDPMSPARRLEKIIHACESRFILAADGGEDVLRELLKSEKLSTGLGIGWMSEVPTTWIRYMAAFCLDSMRSFSKEPPRIANRSTDAAHILFTSGSTGEPKGIVIRHSSVIHFVEWANAYFEINSSDRLSGHSPLHFDLSFFDIFGTFAAGAQLHLVPATANIMPHKLAEWMRGSKLTQWFSVPSALNYMAKFDVLHQADFPSLRRLLWCGEVFATPSLIYWMQRLPHVRFTNLYGPTETTIASSYYTLPACPQDARAVVPIGRACKGEELLVMNAEMQPLPVGEIGYLYIRGVGLSEGYWRDDARTRQAFVRFPHGTDMSEIIYKTGDLARVGEDGMLYFVGRTDTQVKSRGYRIDLGEIEVALNAMEGLKECAVVALTTENFDGIVLSCAYATVPDSDATPARLKKGLEKVLPRYMLPSKWMALNDLPKNANGKIDRPRLKQILQSHAAANHQLA